MTVDCIVEPLSQVFVGGECESSHHSTEVYTDSRDYPRLPSTKPQPPTKVLFPAKFTSFGIVSTQIAPLSANNRCERRANQQDPGMNMKKGEKDEEMTPHFLEEREQSYCMYDPVRQLSAAKGGLAIPPAINDDEENESTQQESHLTTSVSSSSLGAASDSSDTLGDEFDEEVDAHVASVFYTEESKLAPPLSTMERNGSSPRPSSCGCGARVRRKRSNSGGSSMMMMDAGGNGCLSAIAAAAAGNESKANVVYDAAAAAASVTAALRERGMATTASYLWMPAAISRTYGEENNSMIDRRAWLEVEDRKHRYAKNLRTYYKEWDKRGKPCKTFWKWLEDEGVEMEECSREQLEKETVHYCSSAEEREAYEICFCKGLLHRRAHPPQETAEGHQEERKRPTYCKKSGENDEDWELVTTGPDGWIFVLRDKTIYAHEKKTDHPPRFHHSSFFAGECVQAAGLLMATDGVLARLYPHSGHYRPTDSHLLSLLLFFEAEGVDLASVQVDVQLVMKVARSHDAHRGQRKRKIDSPYMWTGKHAKHFLLVKRLGWESKMFRDLVETAKNRGKGGDEEEEEGKNA